jgi:hypothetical protein
LEPFDHLPQDISSVFLLRSCVHAIVGRGDIVAEDVVHVGSANLDRLIAMGLNSLTSPCHH